MSRPEITDKSQCVVCGDDLTNRDRAAHSLEHFPAEPIPVRADTLRARQLQAQVLGKPEPKE